MGLQMWPLHGKLRTSVLTFPNRVSVVPMLAMDECKHHSIHAWHQMFQHAPRVASE